MKIDELRGHLVAEDLFADEPLHASFREKRAIGLDAAQDAEVVIFGVPFDAGTYKHYGVHEGPMGIRKAMDGFRTYSIELGLDFEDVIKVADIGNIAVPNWRSYDETFDRIDLAERTIIEAGKIPIMLGGDHSISYRSIRTFAETYAEPVGLIWIDNHYDTMPPFRGDPLFCGCPLRNVLTSIPELVRPKNVVHIGSRGFGNSAASAASAKELGFNIVTVSEMERRGAAETMHRALELAGAGTRAIYVTFDIDSLDVVYAPATQSPRPGGLTPREAMTLIREASLGGAAAFDVVEIAPAIDPFGATCLIGAECVLEAIGGVATRVRSGQPVSPITTGHQHDT